MPHIIRRILFITFAVLFLAAGIAILFYSTGYRYHFAKHKIEKTGQFTVDSRPRDVDIYIDGQKIDQPFRSFFHLPLLHGKDRVISILSGQYSLRLSKESFFDWSQQINIVPGQRLVLQDITLVRQGKPRSLSSVPRLPQEPQTRPVVKVKTAQLFSLLQKRTLISDEYEDALIVRSEQGAELLKKLPQGIYRSSKLGDISSVRWVDKAKLFGFNDFEIWNISLHSETQPDLSLLSRHSEKISDPILFSKKGFLAYILDGKKVMLLDIRDSETVHQYPLVEGRISNIEKNNDDEILLFGEIESIQGVFMLSLFEN